MRGRGHDPGQNLLVSDVGLEERTTVMRLLRPVGFATLAAYIWIALHEALYAQAAPAAL